MPHKAWTRVCVDLDEQGNPIGTSYERHVGDRITSYGTGPVPEAFHDPHDAWKLILEFVVEWFGLAHRLF